MPECPKCSFNNEPDCTECPRCGIVFANLQSSSPAPSATWPSWKEILFPEIMENNPLVFGGRVLIWGILVWLGLRFMADGLDGAYTGQSFLHLINLPFHEAGHVFTRVFPPVMTSLGGSLGQLAVPLVCMVVLLLRTRDAFGASACLWWFGQNFIDLAPYINDARSLTLPLLGGNVGSEAPYGFHDWEFILKELGLAAYDHALAKGAHVLGTLLILLALLWGGLLLIQQYRERDVI